MSGSTSIYYVLGSHIRGTQRQWINDNGPWPNKSLLHLIRSIRSAKMRFTQLLLNMHGMLWFLLYPHACMHLSTWVPTLLIQGYKPCTLEYLLYFYEATSHACKSPACKPCMHRWGAPPAWTNSFDLLKLRLARLSFALPDLLSTESSQLRNFLKLPTCLTSWPYPLLLRIVGPTTWVKALPRTLEDRVLSLSCYLHM
jgi:hypothetical protein